MVLMRGLIRPVSPSFSKACEPFSVATIFSVKTVNECLTIPQAQKYLSYLVSDKWYLNQSLNKTIY